jgi:hypothetical protein
LAPCLARNTGPFPREAVRDLLGITRALYRAELALPEAQRQPSRLDRLVEIGKQYRLALELGSRCNPDTMGGRAARSWAETATAALGEVVAESDWVAKAVRETARRLSNRG